MAQKTTIGKTNWVVGEVSPQVFGRFDADKPIFKNGAAIIENMLIAQAGGLSLRPGTQFIAEVKDSSAKVRLERFRYSISQEYVLEIGAAYMRFFANVSGVPGQVVVTSATAWATSTPYIVGDYVSETSIIYYCIVAHTSGDGTAGHTFADDLAAGKWVAQTILEIPTIYAQGDIFNLQTANKADVMYIVHPSYPPQKLIRTSANSFSISDVQFVRGPFLDKNLGNVTITPSADTGVGVTLTATVPAWAGTTVYIAGDYVTDSGIMYFCQLSHTSSSVFNDDLVAGKWVARDFFQTGHVGALYRIKSGVVLITAYTSETVVTGDVQKESDGSAGGLATGPGATADWAEGAFSGVQGYPTAVTFHEQRLVYGGTIGNPQTFFASVSGAYDNFDVGSAADSDAYTYTIASNTVNDIRWLESDAALKIGTSGGTASATSGATGITPSSPPTITVDTDAGVMTTQPQRLGGYIFYLQGNKFDLRQLTFDLIINKDKSNDMNLLANHILRDGDGAVQMARQQSPHDRIWIVRGDGEIAVLTRNPEQQITGWCRVIGGESDFTATCNGLNGRFETITVLPIDGGDDQIWVVCERRISGSFKRFVEVFTDELFEEDWEPVRVDCSLSLDEPLDITAISQANPMVVTSVGHGLSDGDLVKIDSVIGMNDYLNGKTFVVQNSDTDTFELGLYTP